MSRSSYKQQINLTLRLLVILLSGQKTTPDVIAKSLGVSVAWVFKTLDHLREAGMKIAYDRIGHTYSVGISEEMAEGFVPKLATRFNRAVKAKGLSQPPVKFVTSLDRYTKEQFAQFLGVTPQNVQNMIMGYSGQSLPEGWVAFRVSEGGRWLIQKMPTDRSGKKYSLPDNVNTGSVEYVIGRGEGKVSGPKPATFTPCVQLDEDGKPCQNPSLGYNLCARHYPQVYRNPATKGRDLLRSLRTRNVDPKIIGHIQKWVTKRKRDLGEAA